MKFKKIIFTIFILHLYLFLPFDRPAGSKPFVTVCCSEDFGHCDKNGYLCGEMSFSIKMGLRTVCKIQLGQYRYYRIFVQLFRKNNIRWMDTLRKIVGLIGVPELPHVVFHGIHFAALQALKNSLVLCHGVVFQPAGKTEYLPNQKFLIKRTNLIGFFGLATYFKPPKPSVKLIPFSIGVILNFFAQIND